MAKKFGKRNKKPAQLNDLFGAPPPPPRSGPPASSTPLSDYLSQGLPGVDEGYVVLPRSLAESMSLPWQQQMAGLLAQFHQTHRSLSWPIYRTVPSRYEKLVDLDEEQLAEVGYLVEIDADGDMVYRERSGRKVEEPENTTVLVPCLDPIPPRGQARREAAPAPDPDAPRAAPMIIPPAPVWRTTPTTPSPEVPPLPEPPKKLAAPRTPPGTGPGASPAAPAVPGGPQTGPAVPGMPEAGPAVPGGPHAATAAQGPSPAGPVEGGGPEAASAAPGVPEAGSGASTPGASQAGSVAGGGPQAASAIPGVPEAGPGAAASGASQPGPATFGGPEAASAAPGASQAGPAVPGGPQAAPAAGPSGTGPTPSPEAAPRVTNPQAWRTIEPPEEPARFTEPLPPQPQPTPAAGIPLGGLTRHDPEPTPPQGTPKVNRDWFEPDQPEHEFGPTGQPTELPYRYRP
ncbi:hypothetical protein GCM10017786_67870 [Amycolatopsis deserti]|uniref:Uncharacterized protein n=1 Tax=Amycolatopsis deserti TaxID=185696 RepID=A0ABQ3JDM3_9PSEU|nr:hypothetical protein GCM10017786_67870 [Amycolatopsis deserti]